MFENTSEFADLDIIVDTCAVDYVPCSLPNISNKPISKNSNRPKKEHSYKQKVNLPSILYSQIDTQTVSGGNNNQQNFQVKNKSAFFKQVKDKLKIALGDLPYKHNSISDYQQDSEESDFEQIIKKNKQILKRNKIQRSNTKNKRILQQVNASKVSKYNSDKENRKQALQQKKLQYKNISKQRKSIQQQKLNSKQKQNSVSQNNLGNVAKLKTVKVKNSNILNKQYKRNKKSKSKTKARILSYQPSKQTLTYEQKEQNLFENIQNYLSNPYGKQKQNESELVGLELLKVKRNLEYRIKQINEKLELQQNQGMIAEKCKLYNMRNTIKDWRKILINLNDIRFQNSSFDDQINRINRLQQRNSLCIDKYVECQKILLQLELNKKRSIKINAKSP